MNKNFEATIKYQTVNENGKQVNKNEKLLIAGLLFKEIEEKIAVWASENIRGDYQVTEIKVSNISEVLDNVGGEFWYKGRVKWTIIDESTGREKKTSNYLLVSSDSVDDADKQIRDFLADLVITTEVVSVSVSPIVDVILT